MPNMPSHTEPLPLASGLDALSSTFKRDLEFCEALAKAEPENTARLLLYCRWSRSYLPEIQGGLLAIVDRHFAPAHLNHAKLWTASLTAGLIRDLGLIPYLALRGLIWEAGTAARRGLENVGLLAHLWREPSKAAVLADPDGNDFRNAFLNEAASAAARELKTRAVQKRFAASSMDEQLSQLYRLVSTFSVHGASPNQLVTTPTTPTKLSCTFVNRPDPTVTPLGSDLQVFGNACEMLCNEVTMIFGVAAKEHKVPWSRAHEGGKLLSQLMNREDPIMQTYIEESLRDLGWTSIRCS